MRPLRFQFSFFASLFFSLLGFAGAEAQQPVSPETEDHALILSAGQARLNGPTLKRNPRHGAIAWWKTENDRAAWQIHHAKKGTYAVVIDYSVPAKLANQALAVQSGSATLLVSKAPGTGGWGKWKRVKIGEIEITEKNFLLNFGPVNPVKGEDLLDLRSISLIPIGSPRLNKLTAAGHPPDKTTKPVPPEEVREIPGNQPVPVKPGGDGVFALFGKDAAIFGEATTLVQSKSKSHPEAALDGWNDRGHRAQWQLRDVKEGRYDLLADWARPRLPGSLQKARIEVDGAPAATANIRTTEGIDRFASFVIGSIDLPGGDLNISIGPAGKVTNRWVRLRSLRLVPAARPGEFRMPPLSAPDGFIIEPAAIPPLVAHPMMGCLDDRGRLFIAESAGSNAKAPELLETRPHKILMLEDENGDGVFDRSTVFADNLVLPNGAQWHDGALYVCSPPYIWKFEDPDGDGRAEKRTPVGGKFGFNGMSSAFHGPVIGPDGRLYYCGGQHGWTLGDTSPGLDLQNEKWISRAPGVFSMWPDGSNAENRAQGGMANPVEVTFSSEGEVFGTVAVYQNLNGRTDALLHWIYGSVYNLRREPVRPRTSGELLPPMSRRGWVAPPGLTRYRSGKFGNGFGADYRDDIFLTEFNTHRVYRIMPERTGASYTASDEVFLESTSPYVHFTDVIEDADGSLLVMDTGGWFLYGCPTSALSRPEIKGGIYRIRKRGAGQRRDFRGSKLDWNNPDIAWLDDDRFSVRDRAAAELAKRGLEMVAQLNKILTEPKKHSERLRRNAVWTLTRIDHPDASKAVLTGLGDPSASVRLTAARSCSTRRIGIAGEKLTALLRDDSEPSQIHREAATALGRIKRAEAIPALIDRISRPQHLEEGRETTTQQGTVDDPTLLNGGEKAAKHDPYLEHSLIYALIEIDDWEKTSSFLSESENPTALRAALVASAGMESSRLTAAMTAPFLTASDSRLRSEALRLATARPQWAGSLVGFLQQSLKAERPASGIAEALIAFSKNRAVQHLLGEALNYSPGARDTALEAMRRSGVSPAPKTWESALAKQLSSNADPAVVETISALKITSLDAELIALLGREQHGESLRLAALEIVADRLSAPFATEYFQIVSDCFHPAHSGESRIRAAGILSQVELNEAQRHTVAADLVPLAGPLQLGALLDIFEKKKPAQEIARVLARSLARSPGLFSMPAERIEKVFGEHSAVAEEIAGKLRSAESQRESRLDELLAKISGLSGDPDRGKTAFVKAACIVCHKVAGSGGTIGPELNTIGEIRSERDLLEAIAFPSATFAREYEPIILKLNDGSQKTGRIGKESGQSVELIDAQGKSELISANQIASREMASVSMMPPGLERLLSDAELADLISYLKELSGSGIE